MTTIELPASVVDAAVHEAQRQGVDVAQVVEAAVRKYVSGPAMVSLLAGFATEDGAKPERLTDDEAMEIACAEQAAYRSANEFSSPG